MILALGLLLAVPPIFATVFSHVELFEVKKSKNLSASEPRMNFWHDMGDII